MPVTDFIFDYNRNVLFVKKNLLGANVVDDLALSVKSLMAVVNYHKTCASLHNLDESMSV